MSRRLVVVLFLVVIVFCTRGVASYPAVAGSSPATDGRIMHVSLNHLGPPVALAGSMLPALRSARKLARVGSTKSLSLAISLRVRDQAGLDRFLHNVYDPSSASYHHFLTPAQFRARFAPLPHERALVRSWLTIRGLRVIRQFANGMLIMAQGSVRHVEAAFATQLYSYRRGTNRFFANAVPARLPSALLPDIGAVVGLNNAVHLVPSHVSMQASPAGGYGPPDLARLYNITPLYGRGIEGQGQTVAIVAFDDYNPGSIATFDNLFGLSPSSVNAVEVHDDNSGGGRRGEGQIEVDADVEMVQGIAPASRQLVYEAGNSGVGDITLWNQFVSEDRAKVMTTSWGLAEGDTPKEDLDADHAALQEAAAQGQAVFTAAGDFGAYDVGNGSTLSVDYPSSDPWVTAVGGTTLRAAPDGSYGAETAWADRADNTPALGGGGGVSSIFKQPDYQAGGGSSRTTNGMRGVPDVAANADVELGDAIFSTTPGMSGWQVVGGTSVAAPLWAAYAALLNQAAGRTLGFLNPTLYAIGKQNNAFSPSPFHDVTSGTNLYYEATAGWDLATGWGSMNGAVLATAVLAASTPKATATPTRTATRVPTPTRTPTATRTKPSPPSPSVTIVKAGLMHEVHGTWIATTTLHPRESGMFRVDYRAANGIGRRPTAKLTFLERGRAFAHMKMKTVLGVNGSSSASVRKAFAVKRVGTVTATFAVAVGPAHATRTLTFALR